MQGGGDQRSHAACLSVQTISSQAAVATATLPNRVQLEEAEPVFVRPLCSIAFSTFTPLPGCGKGFMLTFNIQSTHMNFFISNFL